MSAGIDDRTSGRAAIASRAGQALDAGAAITMPAMPKIDPQAIWATIMRHRWSVLAIIATALLLGIASILLTRPVYKATATIQIDQQAAKVLGTEDRDQLGISGDSDRFLQTQLDVLRSRDLAERVVDKLRLVEDKRFREGMRLKALDNGQSAAQRRAPAVDALQAAMRVDLPRMSRVARLSIETGNAALSAQLANAYVDAYIGSNLQRRFDQSTYSRQFLTGQLDQTRVKLENSERAMIGFARAAGLIEIGGGGADGAAAGSGQSLKTSDLVQLNDAYAAAKAARIAAQQQWSQAQATSVMSLSEVLSNLAVQRLTEQLAEARVSYREMRERLKDGHPNVQQKAAAITAMERELQQLANSIKTSIRDRYMVALRQEQSLAATVGGLKGETLAERDRSVQYNILRREVDTNRALYEALLQRFKEVSAEAGVTTNNISLIDPAIAPKAPASPRPLINMAMALLLGLAGAGAWVIAREQLTDAVRTPEDVTSRGGLPLLGVTPQVDGDVSPAETLKDPKTPFSEAVHAIRAALELSTADGVPASLSFTSARPSEGKSTLSYALAREFALAGKRVVLIDADMRAPTAHRFVGLPNKTGLSQLLARQSDLGAVTQKSGIPGLNVITSGPLPPDPTLLLDGRRLADVVAALQASHDLVLVDGPPVLGLADALQIAANVAATILVIEASDTRLTNLKAAVARLHATQTHPIGAILSKFDAQKFGYGENYGYYYARYGEK